MTRFHLLEHRHVRLHGLAPAESEVVLARPTAHGLEAARHDGVRVDRIAPERGRLSRRGVLLERAEVVQVVVHLCADSPGLHVGYFVPVGVGPEGAPVAEVEVCAVDAEAAHVVDEDEFVVGGLWVGGVQGDDVFGEVEGGGGADGDDGVDGGGAGAEGCWGSFADGGHGSGRAVGG